MNPTATVGARKESKMKINMKKIIVLERDTCKLTLVLERGFHLFILDKNFTLTGIKKKKIPFNLI